jgi:hypothetical protein
VVSSALKDLTVRNYFENNTVMAFDHFTAKLADYEQLPKISRQIEMLFPENK